MDSDQDKAIDSRARAKKDAPAPTWDDRDVAEAKSALLRNLNATKRFFDRDSKQYVDVPDAMAQIAAAVALLNQAVGLPIQRQVRIQQVFIERQAELLEIAKTEHGRKMLLGMGAVDENWLKQNFPAEHRPPENG